MIVVPAKGCQKGTKTEQDYIVVIDMSSAVDKGTPAKLIGALGEFAGRIQQNCNGSLINCSYELHVSAEMDGTI